MTSELPTSKRVILAGGSGFLGRPLARFLAEQGYEPIVLTRHPEHPVPQARTVHWDGRTVSEEWASLLDGARAVINLAGKSVDCRYTPEARREILESRLDSARALGEAFRRCGAPPEVWVQAASLAIHGDAGDRLLDEDTLPVHDCFSPQVCKAWEAATMEEELPPGVRRVVLRISFVLGPEGGALGPLARLVRWGLGGAAGSGRQWVSWLHMDDFCRMVQWSIERTEMSGIYNATAPNPVSNAEFMRELRRAFHRPWSPPVPAWAVRIGAAVIMRSEAELVLRSRRGIPKRLLEMGYPFQFPEFRPAVEDVVKRLNS